MVHTVLYKVFFVEEYFFCMQYKKKENDNNFRENELNLTLE